MQHKCKRGRIFWLITNGNCPRLLSIQQGNKQYSSIINYQDCGYQSFNIHHITDILKHQYYKQCQGIANAPIWIILYNFLYRNYAN